MPDAREARRGGPPTGNLRQTAPFHGRVARRSVRFRQMAAKEEIVAHEDFGSRTRTESRRHAVTRSMPRGEPYRDVIRSQLAEGEKAAWTRRRPQCNPSTGRNRRAISRESGPDLPDYPWRTQPGESGGRRDIPAAALQTLRESRDSRPPIRATVRSMHSERRRLAEGPGGHSLLFELTNRRAAPTGSPRGTSEAT